MQGRPLGGREAEATAGWTLSRGNRWVDAKQRQPLEAAAGWTLSRDNRWVDAKQGRPLGGR
eukprot:666764-Prorocentrum_minimum.AAC.1